ncbi:flagellar export chaperone FliS [Caldisalinibacter kiritimatiensis]|uniref:Flagellar secretion chaperone FliS n=1 Tax=Caldisalinibacter kiritimatiensis TaxID=1304284 RepID=R1ATC8_9FIRM|nr:flagellar export chaperone FliS [Caldisalinibacter kiritimatiensis]EOD00378.1 Flagellar biosynthesis protein FliS [Caldisalinibacter kiritimatiensis]
MAMKNPYSQYQQNSVMTASPEELTLMLYNGAVKFIKQGKVFLEQKDMEKAHNSIVRAQDIISELNITLNMDYEISKNLRSLYTFILERLMDANIKKDIKILDEVLPLVEELRDTWKEAMQLAKKNRNVK